MSRALPISTKFVNAPESSGYSDPASPRPTKTRDFSPNRPSTHLLFLIHNCFILPLHTVANKDAVRNSEGALVPPSLSSRYVTNFNNSESVTTANPDLNLRIAAVALGTLRVASPAPPRAPA